MFVVENFEEELLRLSSQEGLEITPWKMLSSEPSHPSGTVKNVSALNFKLPLQTFGLQDQRGVEN